MKADATLSRALACIVSLWLTAGAAHAATYYLDSQTGRDGATGTRVDIQGGEGPLRSLKRLSEVPLFPGDQVLLKCGQTFEGPLRINTSDRGGEGALKLGAYGPCEQGNWPTVTGARALGTPETLANGLRQWKLLTPIGQVQVNGKALPVARYPAKGLYIWPGPGEEFDTTVALGRWLNTRDLGGARAWVRTQEWLLEERRIRSSGNRFELDKKLEYPLRKGAGLYVTGKPWMIGASPAWSFDDESQRLTARLPEGRGLEITASVDEPLVDISGAAAVSIQQWHLVDAGADAIKIHTDAFVQIRDVHIERAARNGISVAGSRYAIVENNRIEDTGTDGIFFAESAKVFVRGNTVLRAGMWGPPKLALAAINAHRTERAVIDDNLVDTSAYIGIRFSGDAQIRRNIVLRSCRVLSDCGAIYTWRRGISHRPPPCEISHNTVLDVGGDTSVQFIGINIFAGIYLDNMTRDTTVADNLVVDAMQSFLSNSGSHNRALNNRLIGSRGEPFLMELAKVRFTPDERLENEVTGNEISPGLGSLSIPAEVTARRGGITLVDAGKRKIALGWVDWSGVDWNKVAPGCRPAASKAARLSGELAQQSTGVVLDCSVSKKP
jgi:hypothetical protein